MSNARECLDDRYFITMEAERMRSALLAVLDECDQIIDGIDTPYQRSEITAYMHTGMAAAVSRVRATINKALGVSE